jgi:hypothetical protein
LRSGRRGWCEASSAAALWCWRRRCLELVAVWWRWGLEAHVLIVAFLEVFICFK